MNLLQSSPRPVGSGDLAGDLTASFEPSPCACLPPTLAALLVPGHTNTPLLSIHLECSSSKIPCKSLLHLLQASAQMSVYQRSSLTIPYKSLLPQILALSTPYLSPSPCLIVFSILTATGHLIYLFLTVSP